MEQYFAQINADNIVTNVAVVTTEFMEANPERYTGVWVETFFDTAGKTYAGTGYIYDYATQDFTAPQPFTSWTWANDTWNAPTPMPTDNGTYRWNEEELEWVAI